MLRPLNLTYVIEAETLLITTPHAAADMLTTKVLDVSDLIVCRNSKGELWDDYDSLIDLITSTIMPGTWDCVGGEGSICPANLASAKALVIRQTDRCHVRIAEELEQIRAIAKKNADAGPPRRDKQETRCEPPLASLPSARSGSISDGKPQK